MSSGYDIRRTVYRVHYEWVVNVRCTLYGLYSVHSVRDSAYRTMYRYALYHIQIQ